MKRLFSMVAILALVLSFGSLAVAQETVAEAEVEPAQDQEQDQAAQADVEASDEAEADEATDEEVVLADEEGEEEAGSLIAPFSLSFSLTNTVSMGALFRDSFTVTNYDVLSFGFGASYATPVDSLSLSLSAGFSKYLTEAGGSVQQREGRFGDMRLSARYGSIFRDEEFTGINLSGSISGSIPTSEMSQFTNLRTAISTGIGLSRSFGNLSISYGFSFKKNFHRDTTVVADLDSYQLDVLSRDGGNEFISEAQVALDTGVLSSYSFSNSLSLSYGWFTGFSTSLSFSFVDSFTYDNGTITANDEFTSPNAVVGRGHSQGMSGSISASYSFLDYFGASVSVSTSQQPRTADNQSIRFPFWDLETGNLSATSLSVGLSASY